MLKNTIAYLTRSLTDASGTKMWCGISSKCEEKNVPIVAFCGAELYKSQASILYHLFQPNRFAGVISWASSEMSPDTIAYYDKFSETPLVCLSFQIPGHPVVSADCRVGEDQLVEHLITVHGIRKIAFIRGPDMHIFARDRYQGYLDALHRNKVRFDERLVSPHGGWSSKDGEKGIDYFLENGLVPGVDFQAVVCVGDNVAVGAQRHLQSKGHAVPRDVVVCGFNGTDEAAFSNPPITTVSMPFMEMGEKAFECIYNMTRNVPLEQEEISYSAKMVVAESCGCHSPSFKFAAFDPKDIRLSHKLQKKLVKSKSDLKNPDWGDDVFDRVQKFVLTERNYSAAVKDYFTKNIRTLIANFATCFERDNSLEFFQKFEVALNKYLEISKDFTVWQDFISILRERICLFLTGKDVVFAETIISQMRISVAELTDRTQRSLALQNSRKESTLRNVSGAILSCHSVDELMDTLANSIEKVGIHGVHVVLYKDSKYSDKNHTVAPKSNVILSVHNGSRRELQGGALEFDTVEILPDELVDEFYCLLVFSLHFKERYMGYIVFEKSETDTTFLQSLSEQISISLYSTYSYEETLRTNEEGKRKIKEIGEKVSLISESSKKIGHSVSAITKTMENVGYSINSISDNLNTVTRTIRAANNGSIHANSSIDELVEGAKKISRAVRNISTLSERTTVLALNASIEAAHAGEAGKGFGIVAREVKDLAAQTVAATEKIDDLVKMSEEKTLQTGKSFYATNEAMKSISQLSERIQKSIEEQRGLADEVSQQLGEVSTHGNEISSTIDELSEMEEQI